LTEIDQLSFIGGALTITETARYVLCEDVIGDIMVEANRVCIDLNNFTITGRISQIGGYTSLSVKNGNIILAIDNQLRRDPAAAAAIANLGEDLTVDGVSIVLPLGIESGLIGILHGCSDQFSNNLSVSSCKIATQGLRNEYFGDLDAVKIYTKGSSCAISRLDIEVDSIYDGSFYGINFAGIACPDLLSVLLESVLISTKGISESTQDLNLDNIGLAILSSSKISTSGFASNGLILKVRNCNFQLGGCSSFFGNLFTSYVAVTSGNFPIANATVHENVLQGSGLFLFEVSDSTFSSTTNFLNMSSNTSLGISFCSGSLSRVRSIHTEVPSSFRQIMGGFDLRITIKNSLVRIGENYSKLASSFVSNLSIASGLIGNNFSDEYLTDILFEQQISSKRFDLTVCDAQLEIGDQQNQTIGTELAYPLGGLSWTSGVTLSSGYLAGTGNRNFRVSNFLSRFGTVSLTFTKMGVTLGDSNIDKLVNIPNVVGQGTVWSCGLSVASCSISGHQNQSNSLSYQLINDDDGDTFFSRRNISFNIDQSRFKIGPIDMGGFHLKEDIQQAIRYQGIGDAWSSGLAIATCNLSGSNNQKNTINNYFANKLAPSVNSSLSIEKGMGEFLASTEGNVPQFTNNQISISFTNLEITTGNINFRDIFFEALNDPSEEISFRYGNGCWNSCIAIASGSINGYFNGGNITKHYLLYDEAANIKHPRKVCPQILLHFSKLKLLTGTAQSGNVCLSKTDPKLGGGLVWNGGVSIACGNIAGFGNGSLCENGKLFRNKLNYKLVNASSDLTVAFEDVTIKTGSCKQSRLVYENTGNETLDSCPELFPLDPPYNFTPLSGLGGGGGGSWNYGIAITSGSVSGTNHLKAHLDSQLLSNSGRITLDFRKINISLGKSTVDKIGNFNSTLSTESKTGGHGGAFATGISFSSGMTSGWSNSKNAIKRHLINGQGPINLSLSRVSVITDTADSGHIWDANILSGGGGAWNCGVAMATACLGGTDHFDNLISHRFLNGIDKISIELGELDLKVGSSVKERQNGASWSCGVAVTSGILSGSRNRENKVGNQLIDSRNRLPGIVPLTISFSRAKVMAGSSKATSFQTQNNLGGSWCSGFSISGMMISGSEISNNTVRQRLVDCFNTNTTVSLDIEESNITTEESVSGVSGAWNSGVAIASGVVSGYRNSNRLYNSLVFGQSQLSLSVVKSKIKTGPANSSSRDTIARLIPTSNQTKNEALSGLYNASWACSLAMASSSLSGKGHLSNYLYYHLLFGSGQVSIKLRHLEADTGPSTCSTLHAKYNFDNGFNPDNTITYTLNNSVDSGGSAWGSGIALASCSVNGSNHTVLSPTDESFRMEHYLLRENKRNTDMSLLLESENLNIQVGSVRANSVKSELVFYQEISDFLDPGTVNINNNLQAAGGAWCTGIACASSMLGLFESTMLYITNGFLHTPQNDIQNRIGRVRNNSSLITIFDSISISSKGAINGDTAVNTNITARRGSGTGVVITNTNLFDTVGTSCCSGASLASCVTAARDSSHEILNRLTNMRSRANIVFQHAVIETGPSYNVNDVWSNGISLASCMTYDINSKIFSACQLILGGQLDVTLQKLNVQVYSSVSGDTIQGTKDIYLKKTALSSNEEDNLGNAWCSGLAIVDSSLAGVGSPEDNLIFNKASDYGDLVLKVRDTDVQVNHSITRRYNRSDIGIQDIKGGIARTSGISLVSMMSLLESKSAYHLVNFLVKHASKILVDFENITLNVGSSICNRVENIGQGETLNAIGWTSGISISSSSKICDTSSNNVFRNLLAKNKRSKLPTAIALNFRKIKLNVDYAQVLNNDTLDNITWSSGVVISCCRLSELNSVFNSINNTVASKDHLLSIDEAIIVVNHRDQGNESEGMGVGIGDGGPVRSAPFTPVVTNVIISKCQINQDSSYIISGVKMNDSQSNIPYTIRGSVVNNVINTRGNALYVANAEFLEVKDNQLTSNDDAIRLLSSDKCRILNNKFNLENLNSYAINSTALDDNIWLSNISNARIGGSPYLPDFKSESLVLATSNALSNLYY
jgi:hypothetical protein